MRIILVQGMTCLGKSTLCKQLENDLPNCKRFSLDDYKEQMWDKFGFNSVEQREHLTKRARELFYSDIREVLRCKVYDYVLIEYVFTDKLWDEFLSNLGNYSSYIKTLYLKPLDLKEHEEVWKSRSRNFNIRHAGHGATQYSNGVGLGYVNNYSSKVFDKLPTIGNVLEVSIQFNPYKRSVEYNDILNFILK